MGSFDTPEAAALAGWMPEARPRVVNVTIRGDRAEVIIDTEPSHPDWVYCVRRDRRWHAVAAGNGPTVGWDDPDQIHWPAG